MEKEFVPYEQAFELAKLNFNGKCFGYYDLESEVHIEISCNLDTNLTRRNFFAAPTFSQAFGWFREKYNLHYRITYYDPIKAQKLNHADYQGGIYASAASWFDGSLYIPHDSIWELEKCPYDTYQEAELACLKKLIEIVKNK